MKNKILKSALKLFLISVFVLAIFVAVFSYEIFTSGKKIFSLSNEASFVKQFSDLIFDPVKKLEGEDENRINILLLGIGGEGHNGGELTDTIMIASVKPQEKEAALLSIPRDMYVQIPGTNINAKINAVKQFGDKSIEKNGIELITSVAEEISGLQIQYYAQLDFQGFTKIIDDLGGIDIYLESDINDPSYPNFNNGYDPFYISKGQHLLDGATALKVARSRHSAMGDFDRIQRQQTIIKSAKQKVFEKYEKFDIIALKDILNSLGDHLKTNVQLKELPRFYKLAQEIKNHKITAEALDTKQYLSRTYVGLGYTVEAKDKSYGKIKELSENIFDVEVSQEKKDLIKDESASIEIQNGTGSLDLANRVARDLEEFGFKIINSTNTAPPDFSGVQIYNNSEKLKPETLDFLKKKFNAVMIEGLNSNSRKADFVIVLGKGF